MPEFRVIKENNKFLFCFCAWHNDRERPNLVINKGRHNGRPRGFYYCFACGKAGQISEKEMDKLCARTFEEQPITKPNWFELLVKSVGGRIGRNYPGDLVYDGSAKDWFIGWDDDYHAHICPMFDENRAICGLQIRRGKEKFCVPYSKLGLFLPYEGCSGEFGLSLHIPPPQEIIITEGLTDAMVAYHCGYYAIGLPCATYGEKILKEYLNNIGFKGVLVIVPDNDAAGERCAGRIIRELLGRLVKPVIVLPDGVKDFRCFFEKYGLEKTKELLK